MTRGIKSIMTNKREIARTHVAKSLNEQLGYDEVDSTKAITGKPETVNSWKYLFIFILVGVTDEKFNHFLWLKYRIAEPLCSTKANCKD